MSKWGFGISYQKHKPTNHVNFHCVALVYIIKASFHQFDFDDNKNDPFNIDLTAKDNYTHDSGNDAMILTNLSKRDKKYPANIMKLPYGCNPWWGLLSLRCISCCSNIWTIPNKVPRGTSKDT